MRQGYYKDLTIEELRKQIEDGKNYFNDICVEEGSLSQKNLDGLIFEDCLLMIDFTRSSLRNSKFIRCNIKCCSFKETDLTDSIFDDNSVEAVDFKNAKIEGVIFKNNGYYGNNLPQSALEELVKGT